LGLSIHQRDDAVGVVAACGCCRCVSQRIRRIPNVRRFVRVGDVTRRGSVMKQGVVRFIRRDEGQDLIEYALLGGIITAALASTIFALRDRVQTLFDALRTNIGG
jgi:Flp pilus assembly pilin Flp